MKVWEMDAVVKEEHCVTHAPQEKYSPEKEEGMRLQLLPHHHVLHFLALFLSVLSITEKGK